LNGSRVPARLRALDRKCRYRRGTRWVEARVGDRGFRSEEAESVC